MDTSQLTAEQIQSDAVLVEAIPDDNKQPMYPGRIKITVRQYDPVTGVAADPLIVQTDVRAIRQRIADLQTSRDITDGLIAAEIEKLNQIGETP